MKLLLILFFLLSLLAQPVQAALVTPDRVQETTTTVGLGTVNLLGATAGYRTFVAGVGSGNVTYYAIALGAEWEVGIGTVIGGSPAMLSRDTVLSSSNGGAKVNFSAGTKNVFVTIPGSRYPVANSANACSSTNADSSHFLRGDCTWQTIPGGGDALMASPLSQFALTTSLQLRGVLSDETGGGLAVFNNAPTLIAPTLGAATGTSLTLSTPMGVTSGGLGVGTLTLHGVLLGQATSPVTAIAPGTTGYVLTSNGATSDPSFQAPSGGIFGLTAGTIPKAASATTLTNSLITESGSTISFGGGAGTGTLSLGSLTLNGTTSGIVTIQPMAVAGTYNFNLPITAGTAGQCFTSGGGGAAANTWGTCGGTAAFSGLTGGTNTTAAMVVGSGASLTTSGSGTINATTVAGGVVSNVWTKTVAPTAAENIAAGYLTGDIWNNTTASPATVYEKVSESAGTAVWIRLDNGLFTNSTTDALSNKTIVGSSNTISALTGAMHTANTITSTQMAVVNTLRSCSMIVGADNGDVLADADLGPQRKQCQIPYAATVVEVDVAADAGTPSVIVAKRHCTVAACTTGANETVSNLVSAALAAGPGTACSKVGATAGVDTFTTCSATLQNTTLQVGDWLELVSGTAGGVAKRLSVVVHYTVN